MLESDWSDSWREAFRIELRAEAIGLASRGWPVLPGTYPVGTEWAGRNGIEADGPVPVHADWQQRVGTPPEQVATWWSGRPFSVLLATGVVVDAISVDGDLGRAAATVLRSLGVPVPIIATPDGRWLFLTKHGEKLSSDLEGHATLHGWGDWITIPPSPYRQGVAHWRVKPDVCGWRLPESTFVQEVLRDALAAIAMERHHALAA